LGYFSEGYWKNNEKQAKTFNNINRFFRLLLSVGLLKTEDLVGVMW